MQGSPNYTLQRILDYLYNMATVERIGSSRNGFKRVDYKHTMSLHS